MESAELQVEVAYSPCAGQVDLRRLKLPVGSTVSDAIQSSGLLADHPGLPVTGLAVGVWGVQCSLGQALRHQDRVEIYRHLLVDPKEARRQRYRSTAKRR